MWLQTAEEALGKQQQQTGFWSHDLIPGDGQSPTEELALKLHDVVSSQ